MLWRIARGKLRRERAVTATLAALLLLSVLLACAGTALLARTIGAGDSLLERANAPDLAQMHAGELDAASRDSLDAFAAESPEITAHRMMPLLGIDGERLEIDGASQGGSIQQNSLVVPDPAADMLLDEADHAVADVEPGTIWLPVYYRIEQDAAVGSTVTITAADGFRRDLRVAGFVRDSTMNTAIASSKRLAVSAADYQEVAAHTGTVEHLISFWVQDPSTDISTVRTAYQEQGLPAAGPMADRSAFVLFTVISEGLVAGVVLLGALLVLVVGLLVLRLAVATVLSRDRREIAVMAAIGIPPRDTRRLYLTMYGMIAGLAGALGLLGGLLLEPLLSAGLIEYVGPIGGPAVVIVPVGTAVAMVLVVLAMVAVILRRTGREDPVDGLRGAGAAEVPGRFRLHRSRLPVGPTLGVMSLVRRRSDAPLLVIVFAVCALLVVLPMSAATTLSSPSFFTRMGVGDIDLLAGMRHSGPDSAEQFHAVQEALAADPRIAEHSGLVTTRHLVSGPDGEDVALPVDRGDHETLPVAYSEGRAPRAPDEIALSLLALIETGTAVGETLEIEAGGQRRELTVVGAYQDLTDGGITAKGKLSEDDAPVLRYSLGATVVPGADPAQVVSDLAADHPAVQVAETEQYAEQILGPMTERMNSTALLATGAAAVLAALLTAMITRLWLAAEATPIAIRSALGAGPGALRSPYLTRLLVTLGIGIVLGTAAAVMVGQGLLNLMLEGMYGGFAHLFQGASRIELVVDPLLTAVVLPLGLAAVVLLTGVLATRRLRLADVRTLTA